MDLKIAARMIAVLAIGAAMFATVAALREEGLEDAAPARHLRNPGGEPVHAPSGNAELVRCRDLGMAAADDAACKEAWAANRPRFFRTREPRPVDPRPERFGNAPAPAIIPPAAPSAEGITDGPPPVPSNGAETKGEGASRP